MNKKTNAVKKDKKKKAKAPKKKYPKISKALEGNQNAIGNEGGRPTKYKPEYCEAIIKFFEESEVSKKKEANGKVIPNPPPYLSKFARTVCGVSGKRLIEWAKVYPEFRESVIIAKEIFEEILSQNGLTGVYNPFFAFKTLCNCSGWRDKVDTEISGNKDNPLQMTVTTVSSEEAKKTENLISQLSGN